MAVKQQAEVTLTDYSDADSIVCWYKISTSATLPSAPTTTQTSQTVSGWQKTEPTIASDADAAKYVYSCWQTNWGDGSCEWGDVSMSASFEAAKRAWNKASAVQTSIDNLEVGGRNLLRRTASPSIGDMSNGYWAKWLANDTVEKTSDGIKITSSGSSTSFRIPLVYEGAISIDETITISFDYRGNMAGTGAFYFMAKTSPNVSTSMNSLVESTTEWVHFEQTFSFSGSPGGPAVQFMFPYKGASGKWFEIKDGSLKLERGNVATDWTPAPEDMASASDSVEYIVGTQTAATGSWTGVTRDSTLYTGKTIAYKLPYAGSGNASLQLKDASGNNVGGNIAVYSMTTRVTTHYPANSIIQMTFDGSYWRTTGWYDSNTYDRVCHNNAVKAAENITKYAVCGGTSAGYKKLAANLAFDLAYPILYLSANNINGQTYALASGNTSTAFYESMPSVTFTNTATITSGAANKTLYVKGTVSGSTFTVASSAFLTTVAPTSADGFVYIPLGIMTSATVGYFTSSSQLYCYKDGAFGPASIREASAASKTATNYITEVANDGIWVTPSSAKPSNGSAVSTTSGWHIASAIELFRLGVSYIKLWVENSIAKVRIGVATGKNVVIDNDSVDICDGTTVKASIDENGLTVNGKMNFRDVLYDNASGTNGTITLSQSAANYNHMRIHTKTNYGHGSLDVPNPNGKDVLLLSMATENSGVTTMYFIQQSRYISGTTISVNHSGYAWMVSRSANSNNTGVNAENYMYVVRVEAWNE